MAATEKISITITKQMKEQIDAKVLSGEFASVSEIMRHAVRDYLAFDFSTEAKEHMRKKIEESVNDDGPTYTLDEVMAEIDEIHAQNMKASA